MTGSERKVLTIPKVVAVMVLLTGSMIAAEACKKSCDSNAGGGSETGQGGGGGGNADNANNCRT